MLKIAIVGCLVVGCGSNPGGLGFGAGPDGRPDAAALVAQSGSGGASGAGTGYGGAAGRRVLGGPGGGAAGASTGGAASTGAGGSDSPDAGGVAAGGVSSTNGGSTGTGGVSAGGTLGSGGLADGGSGCLPTSVHCVYPVELSTPRGCPSVDCDNRIGAECSAYAATTTSTANTPTNDVLIVSLRCAAPCAINAAHDNCVRP